MAAARTKGRPRVGSAQLLDAAERMVLRDGLIRFTLEGVAAEAGVTKQGLLYHYASKDELVFALLLRQWRAAAEAVDAAVARAADGPSALEAIIKAYVGYFAPRLELFRLSTQHFQLVDRDLAKPEELQAIRPLNDLMYGRAERLLADEQRRGLLPKSASPRRMAFSAHLSAMGMLAMKAMVERFGDPLIHSDDALVTELCAVFRRASDGGVSWQHSASRTRSSRRTRSRPAS
jgi:AcrR family transcriptional regulator